DERGLFRNGEAERGIGARDAEAAELARRARVVELDVHVEVEERLDREVLRLRDADGVEAGAGEESLLHVEGRVTGLVEPLVEEATEAPAGNRLERLADVVHLGRLARVLGQV